MLIIQGIDKISIALQPLFVSEKFRKVPVDPKKELTARYYGCFPVLDIHAERLDIYQDFHSQIAAIIYELIEKDFIIFPKTPFTYGFIREHLDWFVLFLKEIEFFFDLSPENICIDEKEDDPQIDANDKLFFKYENTYYSKDRTRNNKKSKIAIYDRRLRLKKTRQKSNKEIEMMSNYIRLEFRLCTSNCDYMNMSNIRGEYDKVFMRYLPYLATVYSKLAKGSLEINAKQHKNLKKILNECEKDRVRAKGKLKRGLENKKDKMIKEQKRICRLLEEIDNELVISEKRINEGETHG